MTTNDLLQLQQDIEDAKTVVSELKGQQTALLKQLKDEWNCNSIAEAEKKIAKLQKSIEKIDTAIEEGLEELESKYHE